MRHVATARFWRLYEDLPAAVQRLADKSYEFLKANPGHPALHFKKIGQLWSVRVGAHYERWQRREKMPSSGSGSGITTTMTDSFRETRRTPDQA